MIKQEKSYHKNMIYMVEINIDNVNILRKFEISQISFIWIFTFYKNCKNRNILIVL